MVASAAGELELCFAQDGELFVLLGEPFAVAVRTPVASGVFHSQQVSAAANAPADVTLRAGGLTVADAQSRLLVADACVASPTVAGQQIGVDAPVLSGAPSTDFTALRFQGRVGDLPAGTYAACLCRAGAPHAGPAVFLGTANWTYVAKSLPTCSRLTAAFDSVVAPDACDEKCKRVCVGASCHCDGFESAAAGALCADRPTCIAACSRTPTCVGFEMDETAGRSFCYLLGSCGASVALSASAVSGLPLNYLFANLSALQPGLQFARAWGKVCARPSEFTERVGAVVVARRARTGAHFVVEAGKVASLEVVASEGGLASEYGASADRVLVVDKSGVCGLSPPTLSVAPRAGEWTDLAPLSGKGLHVVEQKFPWVYREYFYCPSSNIDPYDHPSMFEHHCFAKCSAGCQGNDCFCDGFLPGYDTPATRALCLDEPGCLDLCSSLFDCVSVDMHLTKPRCFLNTGQMCTQVSHEDQLSTSDHYRLIWKQRDIVDDGLLSSGAGPVYEGRRLTSIARDLGYSWPWMLRFAPIVAHAPGDYRVCLCDSSLSETCTSAADFAVHVGDLHVSGVACLLDKPKFRRECDAMYHGGLRCHVATPDFPSTPAGPALPRFSNSDAVTSAWAHCTGATPALQERELCIALRSFYSAERLELDEP